MHVSLAILIKISAHQLVSKFRIDQWKLQLLDHMALSIFLTVILFTSGIAIRFSFFSHFQVKEIKKS